MDNLYIESTSTTPEVYFNKNKNVLKIEGQSYPENAFKFYQPILEWIERYLDELNERAIFEFSFHYLNTSSTKCIMNIIDLLEDAYEEGREPVLNWYYDDSNKDMLEIAQEFKEDIRFNFNIISLNQKLKVPMEFKTENDTLSNIEYVLKKYSKEKETSPLFTEYLKLGKSFKKLLRQIVKLTHISDKQQEHLIKTKKELEDKTASLSTLLDHAGQGFLSFGKDLIINNEYSIECETILDCNPSGKNFVELVFTDDESEKVLIHKSLLNIIESFKTKNKLKLSVYLSLLPELTIINNKHIKLEYKLLEKSSKIMVILTDISEKIEFEKKLEEEDRILRVTVNLIANQSIIKELFQAYKNFFCKAAEKSNITKDELQELYRTIHTFKGTFAQHYLFFTSKALHNLESELKELVSNFEVTETNKIIETFKTFPFQEEFKRDLVESEKLLGENFFNLEDNKKLILIDKLEIAQIKSMIKPHMTYEELLELRGNLDKLTFISLKETLKTFSSYIQSQATYFEKDLEDLKVIGDDIKVNSEKYRPILDAIGHLFRNSIIHGIETPYERIAKGKSEKGQITCSLSMEKENICLSISDNGKGIDSELIKNRLFDEGNLETSVIEQMTKQELIDYIFVEDFSTSENVTDIAGRGVGLTEIKSKVENFGGSVEINTEKDKGTEFKLILPFYQN